MTSDKIRLRQNEKRQEIRNEGEEKGRKNEEGVGRKRRRKRKEGGRWQAGRGGETGVEES